MAKTALELEPWQSLCRGFELKFWHVNPIINFQFTLWRITPSFVGYFSRTDF